MSRVKDRNLQNKQYTYMEFPTINFKYNDLDEAVALTDLMEQKMQSLTKFLSEDQSITCDIEFEKVAPQQAGQVHRVEVNLMVERF